MSLLQKPMDVGILGNEHNAEGIPVQPGQRMKGGSHAPLPVVALDKIRQSPGDPVPGGMYEHPSGLVHSQDAVILIQDSQVPLFRRVRRLLFLKKHRYGWYGRSAH